MYLASGSDVQSAPTDVACIVVVLICLLFYKRTFWSIYVADFSIHEGSFPLNNR